MDGKPPNKRQVRKAATIEKLLDVARHAFSTQPYEAVTFRKLSDAAGMSTGAYFSFVRDKGELFERAMGVPAPDFGAFVDRVAIVCAGYPGDVGRLAEEAAAMRRYVG